MTDSTVCNDYLSEGMAARVLADEAWEGRWTPNDILNALPLAQHTMRVLYAAGYRMVRTAGRKQAPPIGGTEASERIEKDD